jgi:hypothetical protein
MRYVFAFLVPPLAIAMCGRWVHFVINLIVWLISIPLIFFIGLGLVGWLLCIIHALIVCKMALVDKRMDRIVNAIQRGSETSTVKQ